MGSTARVRTADIESDAKSFDDLLLPKPLTCALNACGFSKPSPVQQTAIPLGLVGSDLIVQAKSGTGKTVVFATICLGRIDVSVGYPQALILNPTREIAIQTGEVISRLAAHLPPPSPSSAVLVGGLETSQDEKRLRRTCHIVAGTPGRVTALMRGGALKGERLGILVLDEADRLIDSGFYDDVAWVYEQMPKRKKQVMAFSATFTPELLADIEPLMKRPQRLFLSPESVSLIGVRQFYSLVEAGEDPVQARAQSLLSLLGSVSFHQAVVFCNDKRSAGWLADRLSRAGFPATHISAARPQEERAAAMAEVREFRSRVVVCTDVMARGVDLERVNLVVNLDLPADAATYMHRVGRTGRFGTLGLAVTTVTPEELTKLQAYLADVKGGELSELPDVIPDDLYTYQLARPWEQEALEALKAAPVRSPPPTPPHRGGQKAAQEQEEAAAAEVSARNSMGGWDAAGMAYATSGWDEAAWQLHAQPDGSYPPHAQRPSGPPTYPGGHQHPHHTAGYYDPAAYPPADHYSPYNGWAYPPTPRQAPWHPYYSSHYPSASAGTDGYYSAAASSLHNGYSGYSAYPGYDAYAGHGGYTPYPSQYAGYGNCYSAQQPKASTDAAAATSAASPHYVWDASTAAWRVATPAASQEGGPALAAATNGAGSAEAVPNTAAVADSTAPMTAATAATANTLHVQAAAAAAAKRSPPPAGGRGTPAVPLSPLLTGETIEVTDDDESDGDGDAASRERAAAAPTVAQTLDAEGVVAEGQGGALADRQGPDGTLADRVPPPVGEAATVVWTAVMGAGTDSEVLDLHGSGDVAQLESDSESDEGGQGSGELDGSDGEGDVPDDVDLDPHALRLLDGLESSLAALEFPGNGAHAADHHQQQGAPAALAIADAATATGALRGSTARGAAPPAVVSERNAAAAGVPRGSAVEGAAAPAASTGAGTAGMPDPGSSHAEQYWQQYGWQSYPYPYDGTQYSSWYQGYTFPNSGTTPPPGPHSYPYHYSNSLPPYGSEGYTWPAPTGPSPPTAHDVPAEHSQHDNAHEQPPNRVARQGGATHDAPAGPATAPLPDHVAAGAAAAASQHDGGRQSDGRASSSCPACWLAEFTSWQAQYSAWWHGYMAHWHNMQAGAAGY